MLEIDELEDLLEECMLLRIGTSAATVNTFGGYVPYVGLMIYNKILSAVLGVVVGGRNTFTAR